MYSLTPSDGHGATWLTSGMVPGEATMIEDVVVGFEDAVRQPVVAHELPDGHCHTNVARLSRQW